MANIGEITQAAYYQGNAALGGGVGGAFIPDMSGFQRLSDYTYLVKKAEYDEKYQEFKDNSKAVADALKIDWSNVHPDHARQVYDKEAELKAFLREHPAASQRGGSPEFLRFHTLTNELKELTEASGVRAVERAAISKRITETAPNSAMYNKWMKDLDDKFKKNDIYTPLNPFQEDLAKPIDWTGPAVILAKDQELPNYIRTNEYTGPDYAAIEASAQMMPQDLDAMHVDFDKWKHLKDMSAVYNKMYTDGILKDPAYVTRVGDKFVEFTQKALLDPIYGPLIQAIDAWNKGVVDYNNANPGTPATPIDPDRELNWIDINKLMGTGKLGRTVKSSLKYHGAQDTKDENAKSRASSERVARTRSYGHTGTGTTGQPVSLYQQLGVAYDQAKASPNAQAVDGVVFVPFTEMDEGVQERMAKSLPKFRKPIKGDDTRGNLFIGVRPDGTVVIGTKGADGKVVAGNTIGQQSLDNLDLSANPMTSPDYKALPPGTGGGGGGGRAVVAGEEF